jgi:uncharacterized membrane protein
MSGHWKIGPRLLAGRPRLAAATAIGLAAGLGAAFVLDFHPSAAALAGWDAFCLAFLALSAPLLFGEDPGTMRARAAQQDEGQAVILALVVVAGVASLAGACLELSQARDVQGLARAGLVAGAALTVAASWLVVQATLALHYAHDFYAAHPTKKGQDAGGLAFPGGEPPDYSDFLHFAIVIGVAAQTADIAFTDRRLRRLGTLHSLIAFVFNTLIVALTISLLAGLL